MCAPVLTAVSAGMSFLGAVSGQAGANAAASANAQIAERNAQNELVGMQDDMRQGSIEVGNQSRVMQRQLATNRVALTARGITGANGRSGTAAAIEDDIANAQAEDRFSIVEDIRQRQRNRQARAAGMQAEAAQQRASRRSPLVAGLPTLLSGAARTAGAYDTQGGWGI